MCQSIEELNAFLNDPATDPELRELATQDLIQSTEELRDASQSLTTSLVPKHPFAGFPCLIEIRPGVGGGEAAIFAKNLLDMYKAYCQQNRLRVSVIKEDNSIAESEDALSEAILEVETPGAYDLLRSEAGVHRVQRVPATEAKGRVHTSTAAVMVLPSFPQSSEDIDINDPSSDFYIDPKEIRRDFMRASGAGGQHVNKTESAVRLTHLPTNTVVSIQDSRSRGNNEEKAWHILRSRLAQLRREARDEENRTLRRSVIGVAKIGRADKIRTYNWQQQRVTDHRSGCTIHGLDGVLEGGINLQKLIDSVRQWQSALEIEDIVANAYTPIANNKIN
jgi:peptide chain release factor 1